LLCDNAKAAAVSAIHLGEERQWRLLAHKDGAVAKRIELSAAISPFTNIRWVLFMPLWIGDADAIALPHCHSYAWHEYYY